MAGGDDEDIARAMPLFEAMGELIVHVGPLGQGEMVKVINNAVAGDERSTARPGAARRRSTLGVDLDALEEVMRAGSAGSAMLELKAAPMLEHDYTTLFKTEHMLKDVRLGLEEGQAARRRRSRPPPPPARCCPPRWAAVTATTISSR